MRTAALLVAVVVCAGAARAQEPDAWPWEPPRSFGAEEAAPPAWQLQLLEPGGSVTTGGIDVYRRPEGGTGFGVENGGAYIYRDRERGTVVCTVTAGMIQC